MLYYCIAHLARVFCFSLPCHAPKAALFDTHTHSLCVPCTCTCSYAKSFKRQIDPKEDKNKGKHRFKYPKVQRLVTPKRLQNKRALVAGKRKRAEKQRDLKSAYAALLAQRAKERGEEKIARKERLSSTRKSGSSDK